MTSMSLVHRAAVVVAIVLGSTAALAQSAATPPGRGNRAGGAPSNGELITMLDAYAIVQAQNALDLSDNQYGQFVTRLKRLQDTRRRNVQARNRLLNELRKLTAIEGGADETAIRDRLKALRDLDDQAAVALRREYDAVDEVLDARQQARFRLFEERLERQKLDLLFRARERAARPAQRREGEGR
jgi:Spy/CpxP family protein refolding chaperone